MLKIKLTRLGKRSQPFYRIVVAEARSKRDGQYVDQLGTYNPGANPAAVTLDTNKYLSWVQKGAIPTQTVKNLYTQRSQSL